MLASNGGDLWLNLLAQVPLVGIFVWAMLLLIEKMHSAQAEMMKRWEEKQAERDAIWRQFLAEQREAYNAALARLAEEVKMVREDLAGHDGRLAALMALWDREKK